jgi:hypothetical protein
VLEAVWRLVVLLLHDVHKAGVADVPLTNFWLT